MTNNQETAQFLFNGKLVDCRVLYSEDVIQSRVKELAEQISLDYAGKELILIAVLSGGKPFAEDLLYAIAKTASITSILFASIKVSSYTGTESTGRLNWEQKLSIHPSYLNRDILLVEDIVDTASTLTEILKTLKEQLQGKAKSIKCISLLDKPARRLPQHVNFKPDYLGFELTGAPFVVGYGLDYEQTGRELRYIIEIPEELYAHT